VEGLYDSGGAQAKMRGIGTAKDYKGLVSQEFTSSVAPVSEGEDIHD
jgi:hypothetical protein